MVEENLSESQTPEVISLDREWQIGRQLGAGGFARVHLAQSSNGEAAVVKLIPKAPGAGRELLFEDLNGVPNVVPVIDRGEWEDCLVLVMPRAQKSLRDYLGEIGGRLSVDFAVRVLVDITEALVAIERRVVHRDIKPDNVLLLNGKWCLADFGIARYAEATTAADTRKYYMTHPYAAPEQWRGEQATSATDVYALGVLAYELLAGKRPFAGPKAHNYRQQHLNESPESISGIPLKLRSLVAECLYKGSEARPKPQNLIARLRESLRPASGAAQRLQRVNAIAVEQQAEVARQQSVAKSEAARRRELCQAAEQSLQQIVELLHQEIMDNAPVTKASGGLSWSWSLNKASLSIASAKKARMHPHVESLFEVMAFSSIILRIPPNYRYEGRSHSLWYCDAQDVGVFRWYETAFMINALIPRRGRLDPFALKPERDAYGALLPVMDEYQVAWPFIPIDQGDEDGFIKRWIGWFADAAQGELGHPRNMPERDPNGTWRRGSSRA